MGPEFLRRAQCVSRRTKDRYRSVTPQLRHLASVRLRHVARQTCESNRERCRGIVTLLTCVAAIAAEFRDKKHRKGADSSRDGVRSDATGHSQHTFVSPPSGLILSSFTLRLIRLYYSRSARLVEQRGLRSGEFECGTQTLHRVRVGGSALAALQIGDTTPTQARAFGELFLGQPRSCAIRAQQCPKVLSLIHIVHRSWPRTPVADMVAPLNIGADHPPAQACNTYSQLSSHSPRPACGRRDVGGDSSVRMARIGRWVSGGIPVDTKAQFVQVASSM